MHYHLHWNDPYGGLVYLALLVGALAHHEERRWLPWCGGAVAATWLLMWVTGMWNIGAAAIVLVGTYVAMWAANMLQDDEERGGRIIR